MKEVTVNGIRLKMLREGVSLTQGQLEVKSGVSQAHISRMENSQRSTAKISTVSKLASALRVSINDLLIGGGPPTEPTAPIPFTELLRQAGLEAPIPVPVVDQILHAGAPVAATDYIYLPAAIARGRNLVAAAVRGDCMEPKIEEGDQVVVEFDRSADLGDVVVVGTNTEDVMLRRLKGRTNSHLVLSCDNPAYESCEVEDVRLIAVVIHVIKTLKR